MTKLLPPTLKKLDTTSFIRITAIDEAINTKNLVKAGILAGGLMSNSPTHDYSHQFLQPDTYANCPTCLDNLDSSEELIKVRRVHKFLKDNPDVIQEPFWRKVFRNLPRVIAHGKADRDTWYASGDKIYMPADWDPSPGDIWTKLALTHERVHINQYYRAESKFNFAWNYATDKKYRLDTEAEAFAAEINSLNPVRYRDLRTNRLNSAAKALASDFYDYAAASEQEAKDAIMKYVKTYD